MSTKERRLTFDKSFGTDGITYFKFDQSRPYVTSITLTADNEIYLTGNNISHDRQQSQFWVTRLSNRGEVDQHFASHSPIPGVILDEFRPGIRAGSVRLNILNNTDILVVGIDQEENYTGLARYLRSGSPNLAFGKSGKVLLTEIPPYQPNNPSAVTLYRPTAIELPNGKIAVASTTAVNVIPKGIRTVSVIYRLNANGDLDKTLNGLGYFPVEKADPVGNSTDLDDLLLQSDGKFVAFGTFWDHQKQFVMFTRYTSEGELDTSFGDEGFRLISYPHPQPVQMIKHKDGRLRGIAHGYAPDPYGLLVGLTKDGDLDETFNSGEPLKIYINEKWTEFHGGMFDGNDNLVVVGAGHLPNNPETDSLVARFLPNGAFDETFNGQGWDLPNMSSVLDFAASVVVQPDGKLLFAGGTEERAYVARLIP
ncbi:hypothetical protein [Pseudomonas frederiksbergensis]|uniref:hypothetical protein n=1 Tax=Pseudomonas frederiksbergensis TaxID=104087 RepID=UPI000F4A126B|nr:hypothetical protein [Pseudomonas frederiksbergensis]RON49458.1 hypothetical protein BK667_19425 [Pseudomonas frederiksbergensis]